MSTYPSAPTFPGYGAGPGEYPAMPATGVYPASPAMQYQQPMPQPAPNYPVAPAVPANQMPSFGPDKIAMTCPYCSVFITTETISTYGCCTHCLCCLMCCSGGLLTIFSCLPYLCCEPDAVVHHCPHCKAKLGVWNDSC